MAQLDEKRELHFASPAELSAEVLAVAVAASASASSAAVAAAAAVAAVASSAFFASITFANVFATRSGKIKDASA
jgi:di/tricarboxylate transporter